MRVATKYINLTRNFFATHGVVDYRIVESAGATEGAPAVGTAEMIVDITTTGATLVANGLKVLDDGVILRSQANLVASKDADWSSEARRRAHHPRPHRRARPRQQISRSPHPLRRMQRSLLAEAHNRFGVVAPFGGPTSSGMLTLHCPPSKLYALAASCASTAPTRFRWLRSTMCSTGKTRCSPGLGVPATIRRPCFQGGPCFSFIVATELTASNICCWEHNYRKKPAPHFDAGWVPVSLATNALGVCAEIMLKTDG